MERICDRVEIAGRDGGAEFAANLSYEQRSFRECRAIERRESEERGAIGSICRADREGGVWEAWHGVKDHGPTV